MSLKRGLERESCDFCYRRKVRCDRSLRARQGLDTCSQCALREGICRRDDSNDVRIRRRRQSAACGGTTDAMDVREFQMLQPNASLNNHEPSTAASPSPSPAESSLPGVGNTASLQYPDDMFAGDPFGLSLDTIHFLDEIFVSEYGSVDWNSRAPSASTLATNHATNDSQRGSKEQYGELNASRDEAFDHASWLGGSANSTIFFAALSSYFKFAASYLPILLEDAFWQDYHADRTSETLVYAIACRGIVFTATANKWDLQQQLARKFREAFLNARSTAFDNQAIRLDELEALALMIDFEYDEADSPPLHSNLGRLFLKHESLVLMTLQSRIYDHISTPSDPSAMLARAVERRVLLYWHVYGLDAFHCLDRKQLSHIIDYDTHSGESLPQHDAKDYFDAIVALAIIARNILRLLCSATTKRKGIRSNDVDSLYEQLSHWRTNTYPRHLWRRTDGTGKVTTINAEGYDAIAENKYLQLRRAVLWALEINCVLQIECCVSDYGLQDGGCLKAEATSIRVEYESVRALNDMIEICRWTSEHDIYDADGKRHSLPDLAPNVLRNICAGSCFWACQRGIELCRREQPNRLQHASTRIHAMYDKKRTSIDYTEVARLLRDTAATATSHRDTAQLIECLDKQRSLLEIEVENLASTHR